MALCPWLLNLQSLSPDSCFQAGKSFSSIFSSGALLSNELAFSLDGACTRRGLSSGYLPAVPVWNGKFLFNGVHLLSKPTCFFRPCLACNLKPAYALCSVNWIFKKTPSDPFVALVNRNPRLRVVSSDHTTASVLVCLETSPSKQTSPSFLNSASLSSPEHGENKERLFTGR